MALLISFLLTASAAFAQAPAASPANDTLRVNVELIQTPITVLDGNDHFVDGLTREQFELKLDGKPQTITAFERVVAVDSRGPSLTVGDAAATANTGTRVASPAVRGRTVVFFIDDLHLSPASMNLTRETLRRFLASEMAQGDFVAIASASGQIGFLQQFTDNKEVLRSAIDRLIARPYDVHGFGTGDTVMSEYLALDIEMSKSDRKVLDVFVEECMQLTNRFRKAGSQAGLRMQCETDVKASARIILMQAGSVTRNTYFSFDSLLRAAGARPGRKIAFFISDGFLMDVGPRGPALREQLDQIIDSANRAGIVVNTIHAQGLNTGGSDASIKVPVDPNGRLESARLGEVTATQDALNGMAAGTGGRALRNQNYFDQWIDDVLDETSNYYLLGWRLGTEEAGAPKLLKVKVSVPGKPELTVRAPNSYIAAPALKTKTATPTTPDSELRDALAVGAPQNALSMLLSLTYLNTPKNEMLVTSWMQIAGNSLMYGNDGKEPATVKIAGVILNDKGKVAASFTNQLTVTPLKNGTSDASGITYSQPTLLPPGTYEIRVAARDQLSGRIGSAAQWVVVPDLAKRQLILSSLLLGGKVFEGNKEDTPQVQLSVDHRFSRSGNLGYWAFVYNARRDASGSTNLTVETQILQGGKISPVTRRKLVSPSSDPAGIPFGENISMKNLASGRYQLRVIVNDSVSGGTTSQTTDFEVRE